MKNDLRDIISKIPLMTLIGCAGLEKSFSSCGAENFGSDWIVVQYNFSGEAFNCWKLEDASISNEPLSDGVYWLDGTSGNLIHISGWYNRVQVEKNHWEEAANSIGIDLDYCKQGKYTS